MCQGELAPIVPISRVCAYSPSGLLHTRVRFLLVCALICHLEPFDEATAVYSSPYRRCRRHYKTLTVSWAVESGGEKKTRAKMLPLLETFRLQDEATHNATLINGSSESRVLHVSFRHAAELHAHPTPPYTILFIVVTIVIGGMFRAIREVSTNQYCVALQDKLYKHTSIRRCLVNIS